MDESSGKRAEIRTLANLRTCWKICSWSWGESNPRPSRSHRPRYDRSRDSGLEGNRSAGSVGLTPYLTVFPGSQRSFPAGSGLSHRPPLLLLPGCSGQAPRDLTARSFPLYYLKSGGKSEVSLVGASVDALFYESEQLGSHERLLVSTSKPVSPEVENPSRSRSVRADVRGANVHGANRRRVWILCQMATLRTGEPSVPMSDGNHGSGE